MDFMTFGKRARHATAESWTGVRPPFRMCASGDDSNSEIDRDESRVLAGRSLSVVVARNDYSPAIPLPGRESRGRVG